MVRPVESPIHLSSADAVLHAGLEVLIGVDNYISMNVGGPGILDQQLRPHPIHRMIIVNFMLLNFIQLFKKLIVTKERNKDHIQNTLLLFVIFQMGPLS